MKLDELIALEKAATPGPWRADWRGTNHFEITSEASTGSYWVVLPNTNECDEREPRWSVTGEDLDLTVALRNAAPSLLASAGRAAILEARVSMLENALAFYALSENYEDIPRSYGQAQVSPVMDDRGDRARAAIDAALAEGSDGT